MPTTLHLLAGREQMDEALQVPCFAAGANAILYGDKPLTTSNPQVACDRALPERLGLKTRA